MEQQTGKMYSWTVINDNNVIRKTDKSFFEHRGIAIPIAMKRFFGIEKMKYGIRKDIVLIYRGVNYGTRLIVDALDRSRLFWNTDLGEKFQPYYFEDSFPSVRFSKVADNVFEVEFLNESLIAEEKEDPYTTIVLGKEGKKKIVYSVKYERNPKLRKMAIELHGLKCMICGFDFEQKYGEPGQNFIEVHHIKPLSDIGEEVEVNPETDLICVCANCHRIIHRRKNLIYTVDEVRQMINENK
jgi:5-methylcytosine-specific restriction protein A